MVLEAEAVVCALTVTVASVSEPLKLVITTVRWIVSIDLLHKCQSLSSWL